MKYRVYLVRSSRDTTKINVPFPKGFLFFPRSVLDRFHKNTSCRSIIIYTYRHLAILVKFQMGIAQKESATELNENDRWFTKILIFINTVSSTHYTENTYHETEVNRIDINALLANSLNPQRIITRNVIECTDEERCENWKYELSNQLFVYGVNNRTSFSYFDFVVLRLLLNQLYRGQKIQ